MVHLGYPLHVSLEKKYESHHQLTEHCLIVMLMFKELGVIVKFVTNILIVRLVLNAIMYMILCENLTLTCEMYAELKYGNKVHNIHLLTSFFTYYLFCYYHLIV